MMAEEKKKLPSTEIFENSMKQRKEILKNWEKIRDWITPFIKGNKEVEDAVSTMNTAMLLSGMDLVLYSMTVQAESFAMTKIFPQLCIVCKKKLEDEAK